MVFDMLAAFAASLALFAPPDRPRDVWVFRSVLDRQPRMLTIALHDGLWVAYDATNCSLYKAWDGDVAFEGAVYTAVHGPQPRSVGTTYLQGNPKSAGWFLRTGGQTRPVKPRFKGYRIDMGRAVLMFDVAVAGKTVRVEESPEFAATRDGKISLQRRFRAFGSLPDGTELLAAIAQPIPASSGRDLIIDSKLFPIAPGKDIYVDSPFEHAVPAPKAPEPVAPQPNSKIAPVALPHLAWRPKIDGAAESQWGGVASTVLSKRFLGAQKNADDLNANARVGYDREGIYLWVDVTDNMVREGDGVTVRLGGKAYTFGAKDGSNRQPEAIYRVTSRTGGYSVEATIPWAVTGKTPSAGDTVPFDLFVSDSDGTLTRVGFGEGGPDRGLAKLLALTDSVPEDRQPREPGLAVRVYWTGVGSDRIPELAGNQTPNVSFVSPTIDFHDDSKLGGFGDNFVLHITGFVNAPVAGKYEFSLNSDDGSKLWIDDKLVVDSDGLHAAGEPKSAEVDLTKGDHKIRIEYFENEGGEELYLGWKRPGADETETIPTEFLSTPRGEVRVTSPGKKIVLNASQPEPPGDRRPLEDVHPSYDLATIRPADFKPRVGGMDFLPDGRLVICTWDSDGAVYILDKVRSNQKGDVVVKRIAQGLAEPLGVKVVGKRLFVLQKQELTELVDTNGDEVIDEYRTIANGWGVTDNFHEFAFGLAYKDGFFYANLAIAINPGGRSTQPQNQDRGSTIQIGLDGSYKLIAHGLRTPNGVGLGFNGDVFLTDNQGDWLPSSKLIHLKPGAFYGNRSVNFAGTANEIATPPVVWLPQGEIGNSPSQPAKLNDGPYKNQMVVGDVTYGGLQRVFIENVGGQLQGSVFRMTQGLEAGINRICWGPDGALYVGGIGSTGNWGQTGKERFGLQRLKYNGKSTFEMLAVRARANGFDVEFTEPLAPGNGEDASSYNVERFRYVPTEEYGGPKVDETPLKVKSVTVSPDRKRAFVELDGLRPEHVVHIRLDNNLRSKSGQRLWSTETWYTLNKIPTQKGQVSPRKSVLTAEEKKQGFVPLFDGRDLSQWIGYRKDHLPKGWRVEGDTLTYDPRGGEGGDIMTKAEYESFELRLEWKISPGGNSGVMYRVNDSLDIAWLTGPEMQVLDNARHPDGRNPLTSAGAVYAMYPADQKAANGANQWNEVRLVVRGSDVEHWLNGKRMAKYTFGSPEWEQLYKNSKFKDMKDYGRMKTGHLVLQDHGDQVWYRNIRIKKLD